MTQQDEQDGDPTETLEIRPEPGFGRSLFRASRARGGRLGPSVTLMLGGGATVAGAGTTAPDRRCPS